jgi:hypothetical protein
MPVDVLPAVEYLREYPELLVVLTLVIRAAIGYQRGLSWYEYRTWHGVRRALFPWLNRTLKIVRFVNHKPAGRESPEFIATVDMSVRETASVLREGGAMWHLISSIKRRPDGHGDTLTRAHVVWFHGDEHQTEAYLFRNADGTTDVYAHYEAGVVDPVGHLTEPQRQGDPKGVVRGALAAGDKTGVADA